MTNHFLLYARLTRLLSTLAALVGMVLLLQACSAPPEALSTPRPAVATVATTVEPSPTPLPAPSATPTVSAEAAALRATSAAAATAGVVATDTAAARFAEARQLFRDEFVDNRNAWFTGVLEGRETNLIEEGVFKVRWATNGTSYELYLLESPQNFISELDCEVVSGGSDGSCGLIFAQNADSGFYKYELFADYYRLFIVVPNADPQILSEGNPAEAINPTGPNRLRVVRQGDQIQLELNDQALASVSDSTFGAGRIGISSSSYQEAGGVEVWFDNFTLWALP